MVQSWEQSRKQLASLATGGHTTASNDEMIDQITGIEEEEVERNRRLKKQLSELQNSRVRRDLGGIAATHTSNIKAMELMFQQQQDSLKELIGSSLPTSPGNNYHITSGIQPVHVSVPNHMQPSPHPNYAAHHSLPSPVGQVEHLRRELSDAYEEIKLLQQEITRHQSIKAEDERVKSAMQKQIDRLLDTAREGSPDPQFHTAIEEKMKEIAELVVKQSGAGRRGSKSPSRDPSKKKVVSKSPSPIPPTTSDSSLHSEIRRLKAELQAKSNHEEVLSRRLNQLAKMPPRQMRYT